jgi:LmbE family N-acetylglucosaminyl deacetylase
MRASSLNLQSSEVPTILCLGAHSDDIEIGALATILGLAGKYPSAHIFWVVFSAIGDRKDEARASAEYCVKGFGASDILLHEFHDGHFPQETADIKSKFEALKADCKPDLILTHYRDDRHQDHGVISDLTWQTFRNHMILEYEIPKYDGDFGVPNVFSPASTEIRDEKLAVLEKYFGSQRSKSWFTADLFSSLMRLRGMECNAPSGFAEAFYGRKILID